MVYDEVFSWENRHEKTCYNDIGLCVHIILTIYGFSNRHKFGGCTWSLRALSQKKWILNSDPKTLWSDILPDSRLLTTWGNSPSDPTAKIGALDNGQSAKLTLLYTCRTRTFALWQLGRAFHIGGCIWEAVNSASQRLAELNSQWEMKNAAKRKLMYRSFRQTWVAIVQCK